MYGPNDGPHTTTTRVTTTKLATTNTSRCSRCSNGGSWGSTTMGLSRCVCLESPGSVFFSFFFHINLTKSNKRTKHRVRPNPWPSSQQDPVYPPQNRPPQHLEVQQLQQRRTHITPP